MPFSINRDQAISSMEDDEVMLVNVETTYYYGLNSTGTFVWNFLAEHDASLEEIVRAVSAEYEMEPAEIRDDIERLLQELKQEQLILER